MREENEKEFESRNQELHELEFSYDSEGELTNDYLYVIADALTAIADVLEAQEQRELDRIKAEELMKSLDKWGGVSI